MGTYNPRNRRMTRYDVLEQEGYFASNPANADSMSQIGERLYVGPIAYPKMLYHPKGEERVTRQAEIIATPLGPRELGMQKELISAVVNNEEEEEALLNEGWHDHPAKAIAARGDAPPDMGPAVRAKNLAAENELLHRENERLKRQGSEIETLKKRLAELEAKKTAA